MVQLRLADLAASIVDVPMFGCSLLVVLAVRLPAAVRTRLVTLHGANVAPVPTGKVTDLVPVVAQIFCNVPSTKLPLLPPVIEPPSAMLAVFAPVIRLPAIRLRLVTVTPAELVTPPVAIE